MHQGSSRSYTKPLGPWFTAGDSQNVHDLIQRRRLWGFAMASAVVLRADFDGAVLRMLARLSGDANQVRRLLALAAIYDGGARHAAAQVGGVGLQTVRDWLLRFNTNGPEGLLDGNPPRSKYKIASTVRRTGHLRGRPTCEGGGKNGSSTVHSASVKSLGKASCARAYCTRAVSVHIVEFPKFVAKPRESATWAGVKLTR